MVPVTAGMTFVAQFFVCRVVIANYYWWPMISAVAALDSKPVRNIHHPAHFAAPSNACHAPSGTRNAAFDLTAA